MSFALQCLAQQERIMDLVRQLDVLRVSLHPLPDDYCIDCHVKDIQDSIHVIVGEMHKIFECSPDCCCCI
jgi:hypothetical protein